MEFKKTSYRFTIGLILLVYICVQIYCINQLSPNYDEDSFAAYGTTVLKLQREKDIVAFESKLPITALNMIPRAIEQVIRPGLTKTWPESQSDIIHGRYISLLFAVMLGLLIYFWTSKLYNSRTALFVLITYLLCPNFLAHGIFVSSDIFACFFMTAALCCLWFFFESSQNKYFLLMSIATGLAEISKFSMVHLLLLIPSLFIVGLLRKHNLQEAKNLRGRHIIGYLAIFFAINWLIVCSGHLFYQVFTPIKEYNFRSNAFKSAQAFFNSVLPRFPVPLPSSYIQSMDAVMYFDYLGGGVQGSLNGAPYLLGESSIKGFWYYYIVVAFYKLPLSLLVFWVTSFAVSLSKSSRKLLFRDDIFLLVPIFYYLIYMSFFYSTQVGIRHLLIIFPLLFIFSGKAISRMFISNQKWVAFLLIGYQAISVLAYFPHFLPYTNEFILDKKFAYKKIADTNICYGEGKQFLETYLLKHPDVVYMPDTLQSGKVILEVNEMLNLDMATIHKYDWARSLRPVDHIHSQYLVFNVTMGELDSIQKHREL